MEVGIGFFFAKWDSSLQDHYYVTVDSIEQDEEKAYHIILEGMLSREFEALGDSNILQAYEKVTPHVFVIKLSEEDYNKHFPNLNRSAMLSRWLILRTTRDNRGIPASLIIDNAADPELLQTYIHTALVIGKFSNLMKRIISFFSRSHFKKSNSDLIQEHLTNIKRANPRPGKYQLNVYNVGHGSLTAVVNGNNKPLFYFDLGGAWGPHKFTYRNTLRLCFSRAKTVIISHWDLDHVETARRLFHANPASLADITWIAPKIPLSTVYTKLAARMAASRILHIWPGHNIPPINFWAGQLIKCNGPEKNHSGIALLVHSPRNSIKNTLHPADAAYIYIPGINNEKLDGLVATHHGANYDQANFPTPLTNNGCIAYSHAHRYGHPTTASILSHRNAGWTNRLDTTAGHISFSIHQNNLTVPCAGRHCDLTINQSF